MENKQDLTSGDYHTASEFESGDENVKGKGLDLLKVQPVIYILIKFSSLMLHIETITMYLGRRTSLLFRSPGKIALERGNVNSIQSPRRKV